MNGHFRKPALPVILLASTVLFSGCATQGTPPPSISLDGPVQAQPLPEAPKPVEVVTVPEVLALPGQMKPLAGDAKATLESPDEKVRVTRANTEARVAPTREGYVNAIQVWPFTDGALYQVYAAVGRVTVIALQPGEELVTVAAGDTVRWIVGDTSSGSGDALRVNVMVKPIRSGLKTNLVITTSRRTYLLELTSTEKTWMASVSWEYPKDRMLALQRQAQAASAIGGEVGVDILWVQLAQVAAGLCIPAQEGRSSILPLSNRAFGQPAFVAHPTDKLIKVVCERNWIWWRSPPAEKLQPVSAVDRCSLRSGWAWCGLSLDQLVQARGIDPLSIAQLHALRQPENLRGPLVLRALHSALLSAVLQITFAFIQKRTGTVAVESERCGVDGFEHDRSPGVEGSVSTTAKLCGVNHPMNLDLQ